MSQPLPHPHHQPGPMMGHDTQAVRVLEGRSRDERLPDLMRCAQEGDPAAYRDFLSIAVLVLQSAYLALLGRRDCETLVTAAINAAHDKRHTCHVDRPVEPWLFAIAEYKRHQLAMPFRHAWRLSRLARHQQPAKSNAVSRTERLSVSNLGIAR